MIRSDFIALSAIVLGTSGGWLATDRVLHRAETILEVAAADGHSRVPFGVISNDPYLAREIENFVTPVTVRLRGRQFDATLTTASDGDLRVTIRQSDKRGSWSASGTGASLHTSVRKDLIAVRETASRDTPDPHAVFFGAFRHCRSSGSGLGVQPGYMHGERRRCLERPLMDVQWSESGGRLVFPPRNR